VAIAAVAYKGYEAPGLYGEDAGIFHDAAMNVLDVIVFLRIPLRTALFFAKNGARSS
jgi:hypothetical protein